MNNVPHHRVLVPHLPLRYDKLVERLVPSQDLSAAERFGTVVVASSGERWDRDVGAIVGHCAQLDADDYIVAVGDVLALAAAITLMNTAHGSVRLLRYDRRARQYVCEELALPLDLAAPGEDVRFGL